MTRLVDMTGQRWGMFTVLSRAQNKGTQAMWVCQCDCGTIKDVLGVYLRNGHTTSCGCRKGSWNIRHGANRRGKRTPEYNTWAAIRERCGNPKNRAYKNYGGRGIKVCKRWLDCFENFLDDMGPRPSSEHSIERVNNNKGYSPGNCIWATKEVQARNRRRRPSREKCPRGHAMSKDNVYIRSNGKRACRSCRAINMKDYYERQRTAK